MKNMLSNSYQRSDMLNIAGFYPSSTCLGPGNRAMIWLQGCLQKCPGCITPEMQPLENKEWVSVSNMAELIGKIQGIDGVTVMGGEPMLQVLALTSFFSLIKNEYDLGIMMFTGYYKNELMNMGGDSVNELFSHIDILIDGPYIKKLDFSQKWRGSENQNMYFLSNRYEHWKWVKENRIRDLNVKIDKNGNYLVLGIPTSSRDPHSEQY